MEEPAMKALVRPPGPRLAEGIVTHIEREPVDLDLAHTQWQAYVEALQKYSWTTVEVPSAPDCPDAVFVEDTVVVYRNVALITRPGADPRKPEVVDVVDSPSFFPHFRAVPEESGSHVVLLGQDRLLLAADCPESADMFARLGYEPIPVDISEFQKLEGCVTCLSVRLRAID
jgi:N-dimethylarginine dimethylaminohydrolase